MSDIHKNEFCIGVSFATKMLGPSQVEVKELYRELKTDVSRAAAIVPAELRPHIEEKTSTTSGAKSGGEIEAILVTLMLGKYAVQPIFNFIVNLYHEKKRRLRITGRSPNAQGEMRETEIEYEGIANQKELLSLVEDTVTWSRQSTVNSRSSGKEPPLPNIDVKVLSLSNKEKKQ